ncbi:hypothetical protein [Streptomyces sp. NPDC056512]|uniref:hypothetical protein n=1 Tax=Streptomyces sp. NPDC056512 TaxID=3345846 RepID=UPI0036A17028
MEFPICQADRAEGAVRPDSSGCQINSSAAFGSWIAERPAAELARQLTFVICTEPTVIFGWRRDEASMWPVPAEQRF